MAAVHNGGTDQVALAIERLIERLQQQRLAMLRPDADPVTEIEAATRQVEQALAAVAALTAGTRDRPASSRAIEPATVARLREALRAGHQAQVLFAGGNRRALAALFGAPDLYSR